MFKLFSIVWEYIQQSLDIHDFVFVWFAQIKLSNKLWYSIEHRTDRCCFCDSLDEDRLSSLQIGDFITQVDLPLLV